MSPVFKEKIQSYERVGSHLVAVTEVGKIVVLAEMNEVYVGVGQVKEEKAPKEGKKRGRKPKGGQSGPVITVGDDEIVAA